MLGEQLLLLVVLLREGEWTVMLPSEAVSINVLFSSYHIWSLIPCPRSVLKNVWNLRHYQWGARPCNWNKKLHKTIHLAIRKANDMLEIVRKGLESEMGNVITPLWKLVVHTLNILCSLSSSISKKIHKNWKKEEKGSRVIKDLEWLPWGEWLSCLEKRCFCRGRYDFCHFCLQNCEWHGENG